MFSQFALLLLITGGLARSFISQITNQIAIQSSTISVNKATTKGQLGDIAAFYLPEGNRDLEAEIKSHLSKLNIDPNDVVIRTQFHSKEYGSIISFRAKSIAAVTALSSYGGATRLPVHQIEAPQGVLHMSSTLPTNPELIHKLTGADKARDSGLTGAGIKVGVIDSGVDYNHPALGGGFGPGYKIAYGYDLVGDDYFGANPVPDDDPMDDCSDSSHGTHVAGIVGGDTTLVEAENFKSPSRFTGVAPNAIMGAYRVFGCSANNTGSDILAAAILRAAADGSDIITLSIGGSPNFQDTDVAVIAAEAVSKRGKIVLAAAGNAGSAGAYTGGTPGFGEKVIGVSSFDNVENPAPYLSVSGANTAVNFGSQSPPFEDSFSLKDIVVNDLNAEASDNQNDGANITSLAAGKPVLIRWGMGIGSAARCNNAAAAGATHCILYDNVPGKGLSANILGAEEIPSVLISNYAGLSILKAIKNNTPVRAVVEPSKFFDFPVPTSGTVSDFSSRGLDLELALKPNIAGVGGKVLSTISSFALTKNPQAWKTPYAVYSGTSMATPNLAGALALLLEHMKKNNEPISLESVKAKIQNTANPGTVFESLKYDSVIAQGAGLFNIYDAINKKTSITPSEIALNDTARLVRTHEITITNEGTIDLNYVVLHKRAASFAPYAKGDDAIQTYSSESLGNYSASVTFSPSRFTLKAGKSKVVKVKFTPPKRAPLLSFYSGFIQVVNEADEILTVPYAGVIGNYKSASVLSRKSAMFDNWTKDTLSVKLTTGFYRLDATEVGKAETLRITPNPDSSSLIFPLYSTTTRYSSFNISYMGDDQEVLDFISENNLTRDNCGQPWVYSSNGAGIQDGQVSRYSILPNQLTSPILYLWRGEVSNGRQVKRLPEGEYKISIYALRQFGEMDWNRKETEFDVSIKFNHRFMNPTSSNFVSRCIRKYI